MLKIFVFRQNFLKNNKMNDFDFFDVEYILKYFEKFDVIYFCYQFLIKFTKRIICCFSIIEFRDQKHFFC